MMVSLFLLLQAVLTLPMCGISWGDPYKTNIAFEFNLQQVVNYTTQTKIAFLANTLPHELDLI